MKRVYVDLHLRPDLRNHEQTGRLTSKAFRLGYKLVGVPFPHDCKSEEIEKVRELCREVGLDLATRTDLRPKTPNELTREVRRLRRKFEVICVFCESKTVARQAAKDRRVDILNFPSPAFRDRFFDSAEAELASSASASFEVDMKPLLTLEGPSRSRFLSILRRETAVAKGFHVPVVISSGISDGLLMRRPMELAMLASLFDFGKDSALNAVSENPAGIVSRNRTKLDSRFVAPGIRVVKRGKDC